jgi:hypothetical protein
VKAPGGNGGAPVDPDRLPDYKLPFSFTRSTMSGVQREAGLAARPSGSAFGRQLSRSTAL